MATMTYTGKLHNGKVELPTWIDLPEGSEVYVVAQVAVEKRIAQKKANGWLVDRVGNLVMADDGMLIQHNTLWVWRFYAYLSSLAHEPYGPIGYVDVNANTGSILNDQDSVELMYKRGAHFIHSA